MRNSKVYKLVITALFIALAFVGTTYTIIPIGVSKVHLGNFICILASLLVGGVYGGIAGSVGMTLSDIISSYGPDTYLRTFIVKFFLGLIVGYVFKLLLTKKVDVKKLLFGFMSLFALLGLTFLGVLIFNDGYINGKLKVDIYPIVLSFIMSALMLILALLTNKLNDRLNKALLATSAGVVVNIILEFALKVPLKVFIANMSWGASFLYALTSLPGALVTGVITIVIIGLIYSPIYLATKNINKLTY